MSIKKLERRKEVLLDELYELHFAEPSPKVYQQRRSEIEYEIACIEDTIDLEKRMWPMKVMLFGFIVAAIVLLIWASIKIN